MRTPCIVLVGLTLVGAPVPAAAQTEAQRVESVRQDVLTLRRKLRTAVAARDRPALEQLYAENFNHVRESSRTDLKRERIDGLLKGESAIEIAPEDELIIEAFGPTTAVATGVSPIRDRETGKTTPFRWLAVYVKLDGAWRIALSQANRLPKRR